MAFGKSLGLPPLGGIASYREAALAALTADPAAAARAAAWGHHLQAYLCAAGGIWGDQRTADATLPPPRATAPFAVDLIPRRDERFGDLYNFGSFVDAVAYDA